MRLRDSRKMAPKKRTQDVQTEGDWSFSSLLLSSHVLDGLNEVGFKTPSPVQVKSIPLGKCGLDLIVQAKSGTGKTCVFAVVALEMVFTASLEAQVIVLAPTREIAAQIHEFFCNIGSSTPNLLCNVFIGGTAVEEDRKKLSKCQIVIGTPGRVKSLIDTGLLLTHTIRLFVLDEADKLLEPGSFQDQINWIYSTLPKNKQVLALSATYPDYLAEHLTHYMNDPAHIRLNTEEPTLLGIKQLFITVKSHHLPHIVFEHKAKKLAKFLKRFPFQQCMVFSNYQARAQLLADMLSNMGWPASCIAGNQSQNERFDAMKQLKEFKCRILISTDLTSRGIDCDKVDLVVNLDMPWDTETYLHRVGRAGRFGNYGLAVSFVSKGKEEEKLQNIAREINYKIEEISDIAKVGSIAGVLSNSWQSNGNTLDGRDAQLCVEPASAKIIQDPSCPLKDNDPKSLNGMANSFDSAQNAMHDFSTNSKELSEDTNDTKTMIDSGGILTDSSSLVDLQNLLYDLSDHSKDSSRSAYNYGRIDGESLYQESNSSQHFDFNICPYNEFNKDLHCGLVKNNDETFQSLGICECTFKDKSDVEGHFCDFDLVPSYKDSSEQSNENDEEQIRLLSKERLAWVERKALNVREDGEVDCKLTTSGSKSLERPSDAGKCKTALYVNDVHGYGEGETETYNNGEVEEKVHPCENSDELDKERKGITTIELENMLGDIVCEKLIESGTKMLCDYYTSKGILIKSKRASNDDDLNTEGARKKQDERYEPGVLLICREGHLAGALDDISHDSRSDFEKFESIPRDNDDPLLMSEEGLSISNTILSESRGKSELDSLESFESSQASAQILCGHDAVLCRSDIKTEMYGSDRLDRLGLDGITYDNVEKKSRRIEKASSEAAKSVSDLQENVNSGVSSIKGRNPLELDNGPHLTDLEATDGGSIILVPTDTGHGKGVSNAGKKKFDRLYEGSRQMSFSRCRRCNELTAKNSRKLNQQRARYRMPIHEQKPASSPFSSSNPLYSMTKVTVTRDNERIRNYSRLYGAWYDIYRKQVAWINYFSWQHRRSTAYVNKMRCHDWI